MFQEEQNYRLKYRKHYKCSEIIGNFFNNPLFCWLNLLKTTEKHAKNNVRWPLITANVGAHILNDNDYHYEVYGEEDEEEEEDVETREENRWWRLLMCVLNIVFIFMDCDIWEVL